MIPGAQNPCWRWSFFSCNGFSLDIGEKDRQEKYHGEWPVWKDLLERHQKLPFHCCVGGGDQLYCDGVFKNVPELVQFSHFKTMEEKENYLARQR